MSSNEILRLQSPSATEDPHMKLRSVLGCMFSICEKQLLVEKINNILLKKLKKPKPKTKQNVTMPQNQVFNILSTIKQK